MSTTLVRAKLNDLKNNRYLGAKGGHDCLVRSHGRDGNRLESLGNGVDSAV